MPVQSANDFQVKLEYSLALQIRWLTVPVKTFQERNFAAKGSQMVSMHRMPFNALAFLLRAKNLTVRVCFKFPGSRLRLSSEENAPVRTIPLVQPTASVEGESEQTDESTASPTASNTPLALTDKTEASPNAENTPLASADRTKASPNAAIIPLALADKKAKKTKVRANAPQHGPANNPAHDPAHGPKHAPAHGPSAYGPAHETAQDAANSCPAHGSAQDPAHVPAHGPAHDPTQDPAHDQLTLDLEAVFLDSDLADCKIICGDEEFNCHMVILTARSSIFGAILRETKEITIERNISSKIIKEMLRFIYIARIENMEENGLELLKVADKFNLHQLKEICESNLISRTGKTNCLDHLILGDMYTAPNLKAAALDWVVTNIESLIKTADWRQTTVSYPHLMSEVTEAIVSKRINLRS